MPTTTNAETPESVRKTYQNWLDSRIQPGIDARRSRLDSLASKRDVEQWAIDIKKRFREITGPLIPLETQNKIFCGQIETKHYRIEKWLFEVMEGTYSASNLYVPASPNPSGISIIASLGHWAEGKVNNDYQNLGAFMASHGIPVLVYEHQGCGERREYWDPLQLKSTVGNSPTAEHSRIGDISVLAGIPLVRFFLTEAEQARRFLAGFDFIDEKKIGITGASGGGSVTRAAVCYSDEFAFGIPVCIIGSPTIYTSGCPEQINWNSALDGLSAVDQLASNVPKPSMIVVEHIDGGALESYADLNRVYSAYGAPERATDYFQVHDVHGYTHPMIESVYRFLSKNVELPPINPGLWATIRLRKPEELWCCPGGFIHRARVQTSMQSQVKRQLTAKPSGLTLDSIRRVLKIDNAEDFNTPALICGNIRESMEITGCSQVNDGQIGLIDWMEHEPSYYHGHGFLYNSNETTQARGLLSLDLNLVGLRTLQILTCLKEYSGKIKRLSASDKWAIPLLFATALAPKDSFVTASVSRLLKSFKACLDADLTLISMGSVVHSILKYGDLDDVVALAGDRLTIESRIDPYGRVI
ncbi:MAG: hypothetical protein ABIH86_01010 [Planctomycetota bacterium]